MEGRWIGTWRSEASGHHGGLRCIVTREGPTGHIARFRATWAHILGFEYRVPVGVKELDGAQEFTGSKNLGSLVGGVYTYQGRVADGKFYSSYSCRIDHGSFEMRRPDAPTTK